MIQVSWRVAGIGPRPAAAGDFAAGRFPSGTLSFAAGETRKTIAVAVAGDVRREAVEDFAITLSNPRPGVTLSKATAYGTILDDERR